MGFSSSRAPRRASDQKKDGLLSDPSLSGCGAAAACAAAPSPADATSGSCAVAREGRRTIRTRADARDCERRRAVLAVVAIHQEERQDRREEQRHRARFGDDIDLAADGCQQHSAGRDGRELGLVEHLQQERIAARPRQEAEAGVREHRIR